AGGGAGAEGRLLAARRIATDPDLRTDLESALADVYAASGRPQQARLWYDRAIQTFEHKRSGVQNAAGRLAAFGYGAKVYREYAGFLIDSRRPDEALQLLDRSRARTLADGLSNEDHDLPQSVTDPRAVARRLDATLLFYSLGPRQSYLWAITERETRWFVLPASQEI